MRPASRSAAASVLRIMLRGLRHAVAEPVDAPLAGALGLVEAAEREQRLDLDDDGSSPAGTGSGSRVEASSSTARLASASDSAGRPARSRISARVQQMTASANRLRGASGAAVACARSISRSAPSSSPLLHREVGEVVARHRLLPCVAGLDRQREQLVRAARASR